MCITLRVHAVASGLALNEVRTASSKITMLHSSRDTQPEEWNKSDFKEENNHSLVIRVQFGGSKFQFPGDMQDAAIESLDRALPRQADP